MHFPAGMCKGVWLFLGYLYVWSKWLTLFARESQGFYFLLLFSIWIYGPWVWQNSPEKLWTQATPAHALSSGGLSQSTGMMSWVSDLLAVGWSGSLSSSIFALETQPQSSWHKNWGQAATYWFFFFSFIHLSPCYADFLRQSCLYFERIAHFCSGLLSPHFVCVPFVALALWEIFVTWLTYPCAYEGVVQQAQLGCALAWAVFRCSSFWETPGPPGRNDNCYWDIEGAS